MQRHTEVCLFVLSLSSVRPTPASAIRNSQLGENPKRLISLVDPDSIIEVEDPDLIPRNKHHICIEILNDIDQFIFFITNQELDQPILPTLWLGPGLRRTGTSQSPQGSRHLAAMPVAKLIA